MTENLSSLSVYELVDRLETLVAQEREITPEVIRHLAEVEKRRIYAWRGYSSLFDYATRGLGYSRSAAMRRIKVARAGAALPRIFDYLKEGAVSLSTLDLCADSLAGDDGPAILESLRGKNFEEAERVQASCRPRRNLKDKVELICSSAPSMQEKLNFDNPDGVSQKYRIGTSEEIPAESSERYRFSFMASPEFVEKVKKVQGLVFSGDAEKLVLENIFGEALDLYIEKHCPKERIKRRKVRAAKKEEPKKPKAITASSYLASGRGS